MSERNNLMPLPKMNIFLVVFLYLITLSLYEPIWYLRRLKTINSMKSEKKLDFLVPVLLLMIVTTQIIYGFMNFNAGSRISWAVSLILSIGIAMYVGKIMTEHLKAKLPVPFKFSWTMTFLFRLFYLQYKINWQSEKILC